MDCDCGSLNYELAMDRTIGRLGCLNYAAKRPHERFDTTMAKESHLPPVLEPASLHLFNPSSTNHSSTFVRAHGVLRRNVRLDFTLGLN